MKFEDQLIIRGMLQKINLLPDQIQTIFFMLSIYLTENNNKVDIQKLENYTIVKRGIQIENIKEIKDINKSNALPQIEVIDA